MHLTGLSAFMGENTGGLVGKFPREAGEFTDECVIEKRLMLRFKLGIPTLDTCAIKKKNRMPYF